MVMGYLGIMIGVLGLAILACEVMIAHRRARHFARLADRRGEELDERAELLMAWLAVRRDGTRVWCVGAGPVDVSAPTLPEALEEAARLLRVGAALKLPPDADEWDKMLRRRAEALCRRPEC